MKYLIATALAACLFGPAHADSYTYRCKVGRKTLTLMADDTQKIILWRGKTYKIIKEDETCAKFGWHAEYQGQSLDFCTATQGAADFDENGKDVACQQTELNGERLSR